MVSVVRPVTKEEWLVVVADDEMMYPGAPLRLVAIDVALAFQPP